MIQLQPETEVTEWIEVREMTAADAVGVAGLVHRTYGDGYIHERIYRPDQFFGDQQAGLQTSEVAVNEDGEVIGHWAFVFHGSKVAEGGMLMTDDRYRGHGIASRLEESLLARIKGLGIRWIMGEPVLAHTASQEIIVRHWHQGAITGIRLKEFTHLDLAGFTDHTEHGRISVAVGFAPLGEMTPHDVWVPGAYAEVLEMALEPVDWQRTIRTETPDEFELAGTTVLTTEFDPQILKAVIEVEVIGADLTTAVGTARDDLIEKGAEFIELHLPTSDPAAAASDLLDQGFSFAGFLPEMRSDSDLLLLQWISKPEIERSEWQLLNEGIERLADMIVDQAEQAAMRRNS